MNVQDTTPFLVIISGLPCTGKTSISKLLAKKYLLPVISKDSIKESLFDSLGLKDREWSRKLGMASYPIIYSFIETQLKAKKTLLVESNFSPNIDKDKFLFLKEKYQFEAVIIQCETNGEVLFERFKKRSVSSERHPGHRDHLNFDEFRDILLSGKLEVLDIGAKVFKINTTDFSSLDLKEVYNFFDERGLVDN